MLQKILRKIGTAVYIFFKICRAHWKESVYYHVIQGNYATWNTWKECIAVCTYAIQYIVYIILYPILSSQQVPFQAPLHVSTYSAV